MTKRSTLLLREIERGCVSVTWYIPTDISDTLKKDLQNTDYKELFKIHRVECLTVDGEKYYYSPLWQYAAFIMDTYISERPPAAINLATPTDTLLHFSLARIEGEQISEEKADPFTQESLRDDRDDIPQHLLYPKSQEITHCLWKWTLYLVPHSQIL